MIGRTWKAVQPALLPMALAVYPSLFHYANNVTITVLPSLFRMLFFHLLLAVSLYMVFLLLYRRPAVEAALAAGIFLVFFHTYGILFNYFVRLDAFQVEHYFALPPFWVQPSSVLPATSDFH